ncbi:MAG: MoxR family ATPase [Spirochaetota bacterium]
MIDPADTAMKLDQLRAGIAKAFIGSSEPVDLLLTGFLAGLGVLIEDIPGVGKTTLARSLARVCALDFGRIQFTPDLMPGDITGMSIWSQEARDFVFKPGAIMHSFVLADEINRASARTQSALLEAMQEGVVTVDGITHPLPQPFFLVATQNPLAFAGTFPLPEAQLDRFGLSMQIGYPVREHELAINRQAIQDDVFAHIEPVLSAEDIIQLRALSKAVKVDEKVHGYIVDLAVQTRRDGLLRAGISPRAGQHLLRAAQARAFMAGRRYVLPEDVRSLAVPVLAHRLSASSEARIGQRTEREILSSIVDRQSLPSGVS